MASRKKRTGTAFVMPRGNCPCCGNPLDRASLAEYQLPDKPPKAGDLSLCFKCAEVLAFKEDMSLRPAELNDMLKITPRQRSLIGAAQFGIRATRNLK